MLHTQERWNTIYVKAKIIGQNWDSFALPVVTAAWSANVTPLQLMGKYFTRAHSTNVSINKHRKQSWVQFLKEYSSCIFNWWLQSLMKPSFRARRCNKKILCSLMITRNTACNHPQTLMTEHFSARSFQPLLLSITTVCLLSDLMIVAIFLECN